MNYLIFWTILKWLHTEHWHPGTFCWCFTDMEAVTGASHGNDSFCVVPSSPGVVTTSGWGSNGYIFQEISFMIFFFKVLCLKTTLLDKILCHFDPCPVAGGACLTFFPVVTLLSWWLWWLGNGCCWYKYSQLQRFIHSLQSQPSLQWSQWQLNGVTHHEGNTRKTSAMSYELPRHLNYSNNFLNTQSSDDLSWLVVVGGWNNQIKTLSPGLLT